VAGPCRSEQTGDRAAGRLGEGGGAAGVLEVPTVSYLPSSSVRTAVGEPVTAPTMASVVSRTLYFNQPLVEGRYGLSSLLKTTPSRPTAVHDVSHSRTVSGSVVDGHSAHGAVS
jgi:hypothetical protein